MTDVTVTIPMRLMTTSDGAFIGTWGAQVAVPVAVYGTIGSLGNALTGQIGSVPVHSGHISAAAREVFGSIRLRRG